MRIELELDSPCGGPQFCLLLKSDDQCGLDACVSHSEGNRSSISSRPLVGRRQPPSPIDEEDPLPQSGAICSQISFMILVLLSRPCFLAERRSSLRLLGPMEGGPRDSKGSAHPRERGLNTIFSFPSSNRASLASRPARVRGRKMFRLNVPTRTMSSCPV